MQMGISDYELMNPEVADGLEIIEIPVVDGRSEGISEFALIVESDPEEFQVPIVPWPVSGRRPLDPETGICAGTTEGWFSSEWSEGRLVGRNEAVAGEYVIGFAVDGLTRSVGFYEKGSDDSRDVSSDLLTENREYQCFKYRRGMGHVQPVKPLGNGGHRRVALGQCIKGLQLLLNTQDPTHLVRRYFRHIGGQSFAL